MSNSSMGLKAAAKLSAFTLSTLTLMMANISHADIKITQVAKNDILQCAEVTDNTARLACFDKAMTGDAVLAEKAPLDLAKTVSTSLQEGKPTAVLAGGVAATDGEKSAVNVNKKDKKILENVVVEDTHAYSPLSLAYDLDRNDPKGVLTLRPHLPTYVLPAWYNATPNYDIHSPTQEHYRQNHDDLQNLDTKMQISIKTKLMQDVFDTNADIWFGYTQQSYWQLFNRHSRPFRSSDYQPEFFITQPVTAKLPFDGQLRLLGGGLVHESNGQSDPLSRSWNRAYVMAGTEFGNLTVIPRLWVIGDGGKKESDNPDIGDYMGYGDIRWLYDFKDNSTLSGMLRYNPSTQNGAAQVDYAYPLTGGMKAYLQLFHGYGENIQDYNHKSTNIGIGLMFNDFKGF